MTKAFLSHSSKQKGFVEVIAGKLGKANVVYDKWTFESGNKTLDEIYNGLNDSGIFVYFISNEALESDWVKREINQAEEYLKMGKLRRFLPFLIDDKIKHTDPRIPDWIKDEYNIRYISKPTKCYDLIKQAFRLVSWDLYPKRKEADQLFIGRTAQIKQFEERIYNFDISSPIALVVSGMPSMGRRKFIKHVLIHSNKIREQYSAPAITLDRRSSIEDLIVKLYGLGYSRLDTSHVTNLSIRTQTEKTKLVSTLLEELHGNNDILFLIDNLAIVSKDGNIVDWFLPIISLLKQLNGIAFCVISQARVRAKYLINNDLVFAIDIPELEPYERKAFFKSLLDIEKININGEDFKNISNQFTGFPEQIMYTTSLISLEGVKHVTDNLHEVIDYNTEKVAKLVRNFDTNQLALQILKILSESEFLSFNILADILKDDFDSAKEIITQLSNEFIIEYIGNSREFLRLNDSVKDYIQRLGYKLSDKYSENLQNHVKNAFSDYEIIERDISDYVISFKEALKVGYEVPAQFLLPSHYVNAMRDLYNFERRFKDVIVLADRILQNEKYLDKKVIKEIRYWLCHSLARRRDKRLLEEVQKVEGPDHNFLLGFYYRLTGRHMEAIDRFNRVLSEAPGFYRAKRELVQVYVNTEQYSEAYNLARENYYLDKNNPYNLQSYLRCLLKLEGAKAKTELTELLNSLKDNPHEKANEMYLTALAEYQSFVENNDRLAIQIANDAIASYPKKIYPYLTKLEILRRTKDINDIQQTLREIESKFEADSEIYFKLSYLTCKCLLLCNTGQKQQALNIVIKDVKNHFSRTIFEGLLAEISAS
jgi:hypothetical protein